MNVRNRQERRLNYELIDTCWDVNSQRWIDKLGNNTELIDTCWDVNSTNDEFMNIPDDGINRYMLGCK